MPDIYAISPKPYFTCIYITSDRELSLCNRTIYTSSLSSTIYNTQVSLCRFLRTGTGIAQWYHVPVPVPMELRKWYVHNDPQLCGNKLRVESLLHQNLQIIINLYPNLIGYTTKSRVLQVFLLREKTGKILNQTTTLLKLPRYKIRMASKLQFKYRPLTPMCSDFDQLPNFPFLIK